MSSHTRTTELDVLVIGAGFAGLYETYRLQRTDLTFLTVEAGDDVGGTWYWNRYPGARCDVVSVEYSYSFDEALQQEWEWSERYASQPEILRYAQHVADRFRLRDHIRFDTRIESLVFDESTAHWTATADDGTVYRSRFVITAVGCLSAPKTPEIPGLDAFRGEILFTSSWPAEGVDLRGKHVAVIGTGSSGVQSIPVIAREAATLTVFQRTAAYTLPALNRASDPVEIAQIKASYGALRAKAKATKTGLIVDRGTKSALEATPEERKASFDQCWDVTGIFACLAASFTDIATDEQANEMVAEYIRGKIRQSVADPHTAEDLIPRGFPFATKRVCLDTGYYEAFNRDNVRLVNLRRDPIVELTESGIRTESEHHALDVIVFATGFDAVTGPLVRLGIRGRDGLPLEDAWREEPQTYLGLQIAGFPNLFTLTGPGSPSVLSNVMVSIEQHVDWVTDTIVDLVARGVRTVEADPDAQAAWFAENNRLAEGTLYVKADSWFMGANVPGKPRFFLPYMGGVATYSSICEDVRARDYAGFVLAS